MRRLRRGASILSPACVIFLAAVSLSAQSLTSGVLSGRLSVGGSIPLHDVLILATDRVTGTTFGARSDRQGRFALRMLPAGTYDLTVEQLGYRSLHLQRLEVRPGRPTDLRLTLEPAAALASAVEARYPASILADEGAPISEWLSADALGGLPDIRRTVAGYGRLSHLFPTASGQGRASSLLPAVFLDGFESAGMVPVPVGDGESVAPIPSAGLRGAMLLRDPYDSEWPDGTGGVVHLLTAAGSDRLTGATWGSWSTPMAGGAAGAPAIASSAARLHAGALLSGPIGEGGRISLSGDAVQLRSPITFADGQSATGRVIELLGERIGPPEETGSLDLAAYSGLVRIDWSGGGRHRLISWVRASAAPGERALLPDRTVSPYSPAFDSSLLGFATSVHSDLAEGVTQEIRVGFSRASWDMTEGEPGGWMPATTIESLGLNLGLPRATPSGVDERLLTLQQAIHFEVGGLSAKAGLFGRVHDFAIAYPGKTSQEYVFADARGFEMQRGWFRESTASAATSEFALVRGGAHAQLRWAPHPGLSVEGGVRHEIERLPFGAMAVDTARLWMLGMAAPGARPLLHRFSPRATLEWRPAERWRISARSGLFQEPLDPLLVDEVLRTGFGGPSRVTSGSLRGWPVAPGPEAASSGLGTVLLPPSYVPPRTLDAHVLVSRALGPRSAIHLGLSARRTHLLPRRHDLNQLDAPWATDQHGRPILAPLVDAGSVAGMELDANRRYAELDQVIAIQADGTSTYRGATLIFEHGRGDALAVRAAYTLSELSDDAPRGIVRFSSDRSADPAPGDFDSPHRAVVVTDWTPRIGIRPTFSFAYRFDSGPPFTPGLRGAQDVNGDGDPTNDAAFIDDGVPEAAAVIGGWSCLKRQIGHFAARNSCRRAGSHSLDFGIRVRPVRVGGVNAELTVETFAFLGSKRGHLDTALYLVESPSRSDFDPATRRIDLPLAINPDFGLLVVDHTPGPLLRVGVRVLN